MAKTQRTLQYILEQNGLSDIRQMNEEECAKAIALLSKAIAKLDHTIFDTKIGEKTAEILMDYRYDCAVLRERVRDRAASLRPKHKGIYDAGAISCVIFDNKVKQAFE